MRTLLVLLALAPLPAAATTWSCGLSRSATQIVCNAQEGVDAEPAADGAVPTVVRGTAFPLDRQRTWVVDLWSPATDMPGVKFLAQATICYRSPGCSVEWQEPPSPTVRAGR